MSYIHKIAFLAKKPKHTPESEWMMVADGSGSGFCDEFLAIKNIEKRQPYHASTWACVEEDDSNELIIEITHGGHNSGISRGYYFYYNPELPNSLVFTKLPLNINGPELQETKRLLEEDVDGKYKI